MTQDMSNKIMTREITQRRRFFLRECGAAIRCVILLLLMVVGVNMAWGQDTDYSGTYYIASNGKPDSYTYNPSNPANNYYLCPTENWISYDTNDTWTTGDDKPFLTTYKCRSAAYHSGDASNAVWIIEKHQTEDYYYIKHKSDGKYLVSNGKISGSSNANRMRVHIETVAQADLDDKALFSIKTYSYSANGSSPYLVISPKSEDGWNPNQKVDNRTQDLKWYSVNNGNQDYLQGNTKPDGPEGRATGGVIGLYTEYDINAQFFFEDVITRPTITCNTSNQIEITATQNGTITIKYTTDGSTPSADNGETYSAAFTLPEGITTIKAITIGTDWVSNVSTFTNQKRLIQSQNNAWNTTDVQFYMIPGDEDNSIVKVNTTSLFRPSMEWTFQSASVEKNIQYYYIINNANSKYLCYNATNSVVYMDDFGSGDNQFKFFLVESSLYPGKFYIKPYGQDLLVSKNNGNASADAIFTVGNSTNSTTISENAHWKIIPPTDLDTDAPFTVSNISVTQYYKIANVGSSGYYIVPPTGNNTNATTSNSTDAAVVKSGTWYFEVAQAATVSDWCTYYHIRNAETGKYLYFTKDANDAGACLEMKDAIESGNEERYKFTWARTATENTYYIIPKLVKDASQNQFSTLRKDSGTLKSNLTRGAGNYAWTFDASSYHCTAPEVTYDDTNNQIEISSPQGVGVYYTINGADDNVIPSSSTQYSQPLEIGSTSQIIRAVCARSGDGTDNSDVVTIIFNPTITLSDASVTYDGSGHLPTISSVEYNSTDITSECTFAKYLDAEGNEVTECKNAGVYKVVITDAEGGDYYVYGSTTFTIDPITGLIVTPNANQSKEYGDPDPELTYTCSGTALLADDELTGALSRDEGESVGGTYAITQGTLGNDNYEISFTTGKTFEITKKSLGSGSTPASNITCDISETSGTYSIVVKQGGRNLALGKDYTKSGESDDTKYYQVTVNGVDNYTDGFSVKLAKIQLSKLSGSSAPGGAALFVSNSDDDNFEVPDNMTAYIVTGISGNTLVTEQLDNIPTQKPVLLVSTIDANGFLVNTTTGTAPTGTNMLREATGDDAARTFNAAEIYLLYKGEFVLNAAGIVPAGKIYLPKPSGGAPAPSRLFIEWELPTATDVPQLSTINSQLSTGIWYTLDGRRLNGHPTKKGIYLREGKKIVVK